MERRGSEVVFIENIKEMSAEKEGESEDNNTKHEF